MDAVKAGNLDKIKPEETSFENSGQNETGFLKEVSLEQNNKNPVVDPKANINTDSHKSSKEISVEHTLVLSPKHSDIEHIIIPKEKTRPDLSCCVLS